MLQDSTMQMMSDSLAMDSMMRASEQAFQDAMNDPALQDAMGEAAGGGLMGLLAVGAGFMFFFLALLVFMIIVMWKINTKAGQPGWACIVPIYNYIVLLRIVGKPWWWLFLLLIPIVNIVIAIMVVHNLSKSFGQGVGFTLGLIFLGIIFYPILAFGSSKYIGPGGTTQA